MSDAGFVFLHRSIWDHDLFKDDTQPLSKREAWVWLIMHANWKPGRKRIKGKVYDLARGELVESFRALAKVWRWSEGRVRRYFDSLDFEGMAKATSDKIATHITICKYEEYQSLRRTDEATDEAAVTCSSDAHATHCQPQLVEIVAEKTTEEGEERKKIKSLDEVAAEARAKIGFDPSIVALIELIAEIEGRPADLIVGYHWWIKALRNKGVPDDLTLEMIRRGMAQMRKKGRGPPNPAYYETILPELIAEQTRPIPVLSVESPILEFNGREKKNGFVQTPNGARHRSNGRQPSFREMCDAAADAAEARERAGACSMGSPAQRPSEHERGDPSDWGDVIDVSPCQATGSWGLHREDEGCPTKVPA